CRLQRNALIESGLGVAIIAIVGALGSIPPGLHTDPWWPLPFRLDADALAAPQLEVDAILAAAAAAILAASIVAPLLSRRRRRAFVAALIALGCLVWDLQFYVVPAIPPGLLR